MSVQNNTDLFMADLRRQLVLRLRASAELVRAAAVKSIRTGYPPASTAGNPPHTRHYQQGLLGSVFVDVDEDNLVGYVGTNQMHGLWLEIGTRKMKPRPWLRPALAAAAPQIQRIMAAPLK